MFHTYRRLLSKYGILAGKLLDWIEDFLIDRKQRVCIRGSFSEWVNVTSGVSQGSVIGPALCIIFANDMPNVISSVLLMFADDTKLYRTISSPQDCNILIDQISTWGEHSLMSFTLDKCHVMTFGNSCEEYNYAMKKSDTPLTLNRYNEECDLEVLFAFNLKFSWHIKQITSKANSVIGNVK